MSLITCKQCKASLSLLACRTVNRYYWIRYLVRNSCAYFFHIFFIPCTCTKKAHSEPLLVCCCFKVVGTACLYLKHFKGCTSDLLYILVYFISIYSNTPRLYSQWLNAVIYWLINHCTYRPDVIQPPV